MIAHDTVIILYVLMWYFLVALAILFILSGLDDIFFDAYYWIRYAIRKRKTRDYKPLTYEKLVAREEQWIAVLIPCWHEANVIGTMLRQNCYSIDYTNYCIFVGVYPNDPETVAEVQTVADTIDHVNCVVGDQPGPTNKASNLNSIYRYIKTFEELSGKHFDIFVFHDSEDVIHPLSFKLYNYLMPNKEMIQIPVFPLEVNYWNFTHWLYADEFAENHTKDMIVREAIHAHVPSAGVGTAFSRHALQVLAKSTPDTPFATDSLTEDYRTSLAIRLHQLKQVFVTQFIIRMKWQKSGLFRRGYVLKPTKEYIATRALFPLEYKKAVRQKARWIMGIVFQEWHHTKWPKSWIICYSLAHDRKSFITHFINGFGYFVFLFWVIYSLLTYYDPSYPALQEQLNLHPWVWWIILIVSLMMVERLLERMIATYKIYGWIPALLSIPRAFYGNLLNLHALIRAYRLYNAAPVTSASSNQPVWDKTEHYFPGSHILAPYRHKLGDLLLQKHIISKADLDKVILEQQKTGERLGHILCRLNYINRDELMRLLSMQYHLPLVSQSKVIEAQKTFITPLSPKMEFWLMNNGASILTVDERSKVIVFAIEDPTNEMLIEKIINYVKPYGAKFVLIDELS